MSADLFAAFGDSNETSTTQKGAQSSQSSDPFSFLSSSGSVSQPQPHVKPQLLQSQDSQQVFQQPIPLASTWSSPQQPVQTQNASAWGKFDDLLGKQSTTSFSGQNQQNQANTDDDDDGWGDFEVAAIQPAPPPVASSAKTEPSRTRVVRASTMDLMNNNLLDIGPAPSTLATWQERSSWEEPAKQSKTAKTARNHDPNVLFDADDFEGHEDPNFDDDFGDFETSAVPAPQLAPPSKPVIDSISSGPAEKQSKKQPPGLFLASPPPIQSQSAYPEAPKSPYGASFQNRKPSPVKELKIKTPQAPEFPKEVKDRPVSPVTAWPSVEKDDNFGDDWAEFKDVPQNSVKPAEKAAPVKSQAPDWGWNDWGETEVEKPQPTAPAGRASLETNAGPPPTNVPPPSVLLSIFPQLLETANTSLLKPLNGLPTSGQNAVVSNPAVATFLRGYLALATVAARIIAGRKHRWHRDKFLQQGMSISVAGGKGGMKLAGVDKTQSAREDREAAEVLDVWKKHVGRLRTAVAAANSSAKNGEAPLKVPELSINVSAHAATNVATAPKACVVCGLKRDERIAKVDFDVEDSFGEWWVEFWGHRTCRNFWLEHESMLRQR